MIRNFSLLTTLAIAFKLEKNYDNKVCGINGALVTLHDDQLDQERGVDTINIWASSGNLNFSTADFDSRYNL